MQGRTFIPLCVALLVTLAAAGCGPLPSVPPVSAVPSEVAGPPSPTADPSPSATAASPSPAPTPGPWDVTLADAADCPVTLPGEGPADVAPERFFGSGSSYGNGELWVGGLWPGGIIAAGPRFLEPDGSIGMKFGWWRATAGQLQIDGRRLDAPAGALRASVPEGYGTSGFQASGVSFRTEGCWQVTGRTETTSLTFVTFVILAEHSPG